MSEISRKIRQAVRQDRYIFGARGYAVKAACLEPKTIRFLDELQSKANRGLVNELAKIGEVYVRQSA